MMRLRTFIVFSLPILLHCLDASGCYMPSHEPRDYFMYRINDNYLHKKDLVSHFNIGSDENCLLWQSQTSRSIPVADIYSIVYKAPVGVIMDAMEQGIALGEENKFKQWLRHDREAAEFLLLAKRCEAAREEINSPWYYPSKNCPVRRELEDVVDAYRKYSGKRFSARYLLQAERALFSLKRYEDCVSLWDLEGKKVGNTILRNLILRYVAGAWLNLGDTERAEKLYGEAGAIEDLASIYHSKVGRDWIASVYEHSPDSPAIREKLEAIIIDAESAVEWSHFSNQMDLDSNYLRSVRDLCLKIGREQKVKDPDLWYYSAAFIEHILGDNTSATHTLTLAENSPGSKYIKESIRVLRIYIDSMSDYRKGYEARMLDDVKWLERKINDEIEVYRDITETEGIHAISGNWSFFYWNDMLRKIVHSGIVPTLLKGHQEVTALAFANMADNYLLQKIDTVWSDCKDTSGERVFKKMSMQEYRIGDGFNYHDYRDSFFNLVDIVDVDCLIKYVDNLKHPATSILSYLNIKGYSEEAFFQDVIGTRMIRLMRYEEAEEWLAKVPTSFQKRTNVYRDGYLKYDPFKPELEPLQDRDDYKFKFAHEMASLERGINMTEDPDRKALMMTKFATGMKNSVGNCWALSFYSNSAGSFPSVWVFESDAFHDPGELVPDFQTKVFLRAEKIFKEALAICEDEETAARINHMMGNNATIIKEYPNTQVASMVRGSCDTYIDYHFERKEYFLR